MIDEELDQPVVTASDGGLNRLMGLSYAVARRAKRGQPIEGQFQRAQKYIGEFQEFALRLQNADGSWGPYFLAARAASPDAAVAVAIDRPRAGMAGDVVARREATDPRVVSAVECVTRLVGSQRYQWNAPSLSTQEIVSLGHALHALAIYDQRVFKPVDADEKPADKESEPATASRSAESAK